jgi:ribosomal protein L15E
MLAFVYIRRRKTSLSYHAEQGIVVSPFPIDKALFKPARHSRRAEKRPPACMGINSTDAKSRETILLKPRCCKFMQRAEQHHRPP